MSKILIKNGLIINEGESFEGYIICNDSLIETVAKGEYHQGENGNSLESSFYRVIDACGCYVMPGVIDDQVHFRQPGLTHKATIESESRAALMGGITSYMEMPNTTPPTTTLEMWQQKNDIAQKDSYVNYGFYFGATNDNFDILASLNPKEVCGVKVFMGSSTGNMLVNSEDTLRNIFKESPVLVATHCEDEATVQANLALYKNRYGDNITVSMHPEIRSVEACYKCSAHATELAHKYGTRLHVLHVSSAKEMELFSSTPLSDDKLITAEVCVHHLWFDDSYYATKGNMIKWNPAIKSAKDREALREGVKSGKIDVVATDHAPHLLEEKQQSYLKAPSGGPLVQHSLVAMVQMAQNGVFTLETVVEKMAHAPANLFKVENRGFLREGYFADITILNKSNEWVVSPSNIAYKCGWSPFDGEKFTPKVAYTIVNGVIGYENGIVNEIRGQRVRFNR